MPKGNIPKEGNSEIIEGIIIPTAWNEKGYAIQFSLFTFDEREYKIRSSRGEGVEISAFIRKKIKLTYRRNNKNRSAKYILTEDICEINELDE